MRIFRKNATLLSRVILSASALLVFQTLPGFAQSVTRNQQVQVTARVVPSKLNPKPGETISAAVFIDIRGLTAANNRLASYEAKLEWNESVLQYLSFSAGAVWNNPTVSTQQASLGLLEWNEFRAGGEPPADYNILNVNFKVIGNSGSFSVLDLTIKELIAWPGIDIIDQLDDPIDSGITVNTPPVLAAIPDQTMIEGTIRTLAITATDSETVNLLFATENFPGFITLQDDGNGNGVLTLAPPLGSAGVLHDLKVIVFDRGTPALSDTATFTLTITRNTPPMLTEIEDQTMLEGASRILPVTATDAENMALRFRALINNPSFVQLQDNGDGTATISLDPPLGSAGTYPNITVIVFEIDQPTLADTVSFNLSVRGLEPPPVLVRIPDTTMSEGNVLELAVRATKDNGADDIFLFVNNLPPGFGSFVDNHNGTGTIRFAPGFSDAGIYPNIKVTAQDTSTPPLTDSFTFTLTVRNVNRPPVLEPITPFPVLNIDEGVSFALSLRASDPDNDSLSFMVLNLPAFGVLTDNGDGTASLQFDPGSNDSGTYPQITVVVNDSGVPNLSDSEVFDLVVNDVLASLTCSVEILGPQNGAVVCDDTVKVCVAAQASGGTGTITSVCTVNGVAVIDSCALVPLNSGLNALIAHCKFTDALGNVCESADTIQVFSNVLQDSLKITTPKDSTFICASAINIAGFASVSGGVPPYRSVCTINGDTVNVRADSSFSGTVALAPGYNTIIIACSFTDNLGCSIMSGDTVVVFSDPTPPVVTLDFNNLPVITGEAVDDESGIAKIEIVEVNNRVVTIAPFNIGARRVTFSSDKIDPNLRSGFVLKVTNRAGCEILADPVYVRLDPADGRREYAFDMVHTDRYLYVNNQGLQKIQILINERVLNLVANDEGTGRSGSNYYIPHEGKRLIDIASYLREGNNQVRVKCDATSTGSADLLFADVQIGEIDNTQILPTAFALNQNYPNPFNPETRIAFDIPANWTAPMTLRIYNMQGQLVQTLVDGVMTPGRHEVLWNGRDANGQPVATGMYFYQILSGNVKAVKKMQMVK